MKAGCDAGTLTPPPCVPEPFQRFTACQRKQRVHAFIELSSCLEERIHTGEESLPNKQSMGTQQSLSSS